MLDMKAVMTIKLGSWCVGDVAFRVVNAIQKAEQRVPGNTLGSVDEEDRTKVYVCDINPNMLEVGKKRAKERGKFLLICQKLEIHIV